MAKLSVMLVSTFTIALLHTLIPSHWLCFVLVGKAQGGDATVLPRLRQVLGEHPEVWQHLGDVGRADIAGSDG